MKTPPKPPSRAKSTFYAFAYLCAGLFVLVMGLMSGGSTHYQKDDLTPLAGTLRDDADNTGPYYRTFRLDSLPDVEIYLRDLHLGSDGARFSQAMHKGAHASFHVPKDELRYVQEGQRGHLHALGLVADGDTIIHIDKFLQDQPKAERSRKIAFSVMGGLMVLGSVLFYLARRKRQG